MGTFPFGWIRDYGNDNWQILWCSETGEISLKGVNSRRVVEVERAPDWFSAKLRADELRRHPLSVADRLKGSNK